MATKILKLSTAEDIIGDFCEVRDDKYIINKPAKIIMFPTETGGMGVALMSWVPFAEDKEIKIEKHCIVSVMEPTEEVKNEYSERFGSGLVTASQNLII
jgi:hypothetical protein